MFFNALTLGDDGKEERAVPDHIAELDRIFLDERLGMIGLCETRTHGPVTRNTDNYFCIVSGFGAVWATLAIYKQRPN